MRIGIAQINLMVGDLDGNTSKIIKYIDKAKNKKCDIVVFPEMSITGYPLEDLVYKKSFINDQYKYLEQICQKTQNITAIIGFVDQKEENLYNSLVVIQNNKYIKFYNKQRLPNSSVFDEKRYFKEGETEKIFELNRYKIGLSICQDIWEENHPKNTNIIINISASPYYCNKLDEREKLLKKRAIEYNTTIVYCNLVGGQDELVFDGGSMIINNKGKLVAQSPQFKEDLLIHELGTINALPDRPKKECEIWEALKLGLGDYIRKNGFKKVVLGMSGGIDSALVAKLAVDTIGKENVICISMPSMYTSDGTYSDAETYSKELGVKFIEFPITDLINNYNICLDPFFANTEKGIAEENIQASIRGNIIMAFSNKFGYMPLSTGNKSEVSVGYCTLYGDMVGGFNAIKDLYKTQVYELAKYVGVLESIINRPPSAELKADQKDEDSLPPYEILDEILVKLMENNGVPKGELEKKIARLLRLSEYKRRQACPGIKITKRSYGKDYRMPIVNGYHG